MECRLTAYCDLTDEELVDLLKSSDQTAFREIYDRYWVMLFCHARRMLSNEEEARDLVQDLFEILWNKAGDLVIQSSLSAYLYGMVRYKVFDLIDKRKVHQHYLQSMEHFIRQAEFTTDHTVRENELSRLIEREIAMLPAKMREVFELSRKSHFSYQQISRKMDISDQTVKKQVYNALKILRLKLGSVCAFLIFWIQ